MVCDAKLKIQNVVARWRGSTHNSRILNELVLKTEFERLLGGSGYKQTSYLFTPILRPNSSKEERYNIAHVATRNATERCFGVLKCFRCLVDGLRISLSNAKVLIVALSVLHNIAMKENESISDDSGNENEPSKVEIFDEDFPREDIPLSSRDNFILRKFINKNFEHMRKIGQSSSSSSKHSNSNSSNNCDKSQSTTSLNSVVESEKQHKHHKNQHQQQPQPHLTHLEYKTKFYPNFDPTFERGVDVGDDRLGAATTATSTQDTQQNQPYITNTLPNKKATTKKGQKQPKQLPATPVVDNSTQQTLQHYQDQQQEQPSVVTNNSANVMSTTATTQTGSVTTKIGNNNYTEATCDAYNEDFMYKHYQSQGKTQSQHQQHQQQAHHHTMNSAAAAAYFANQQFLDKEQQQHYQIQLLEANNKMQELHAQLDRLSREKLMLETRIEELLPYQSEVSQLRTELLKIQSQHEKSQLELANLKYENESLRNRLHDIVNSPLSDAEKHQIIQDSQRLHSPASIAIPSLSITSKTAISESGTAVNSTNVLNTSLLDVDTAAITATATSISTPSCLTPDWDKHSSSSEISVACLQDKIIQMEETHYSTNEELQATLQELADLQSQLSDAQTENERLAEEKDVLFQSLCRQTEKLNDSRTQITTLQELLLRDAKQAEIGTSERENKLLDLIKTAQEERESALVKQEEQNAELQELRQSVDSANQENSRFRERIALLDSTIDAANAERKQIELQFQQAKDDISQRSIEINRLTTLLENARSKIEELEQDLARGEKTDLSDVLDAARKEKDTLEERVAELQDQCSRSQAEIRRLKDQLSVAMEDCKVAKNNAKCAVSHLEYRLEQLQQEKDKLSAEYQQLAESTGELQVQSKCHLEDKTELQNLLSETQKHLGDVERKLNEKEEQLEKELELRKQEAEEWKQFQSDLLMTVRVANDFKTEALSEREQLVVDNKTQKDKIRILEQQIEKLTKQQLQQNETQQSVLSTVQQEMASRRNKIASSNFSRQDSRLSVKTLIESIENNKQNAKHETETETQTQTGFALSTPDITPNILPVLGNAGNSINAGGGDGSNINDSNSNEWTDNLRLPVISTVSSNDSSLATTPTSIITTTISSLSTISTTTTLNAKGPLREQQQQPQQSTITNSLQLSGLNQTTTPKSALSGERKDPLNMLAKNGGSKRNALLKWCQNKTVGYRNIDITNFSSSWNDGLAFCAILHSYLPDRIPYDTLTPANKRRNFSLAFAAAESVGIPTTLNINDMCQIERPDWMLVMGYVTAIYKHFET